jgi:hypothetical protein
LDEGQHPRFPVGRRYRPRIASRVNEGARPSYTLGLLPRAIVHPFWLAAVLCIDTYSN